MPGLESESAVSGSGGSWTAKVSESAVVGGGGGAGQSWGVNGGFLAVVALRAAGLHTGQLSPASLDCHFLNPARPGEVTLSTRTLRQTRRAHSVQVTMEQDGLAVLTALVWNVAEGVEGLPARSPPSPGGPAPETLRPANETLGPERERSGGLWEMFDERPLVPEAHRDWPSRPWSEPVLRTWLRFGPQPRCRDPFADAGRAVIGLDVYPFMAATGVLRPEQVTHVAPTLSLSVCFHQRQAEGSEWLLLHAESAASGRGLLAGSGTVWGERGELVATGTTRMLCRPLPR